MPIGLKENAAIAWGKGTAKPRVTTIVAGMQQSELDAPCLQMEALWAKKVRAVGDSLAEGFQSSVASL